MYQVDLRPFARRQLIEHSRYLESHEKGLGVRLVKELQRLEKSLSTFPRMYSKYDHSESDLGVLHRIVLQKFPYVIFFQIHDPDQVDILTICHTSQDVDEELKNIL